MKKAVSDLGEAAFVKMKGFKCIGRKGKVFFFQVPNEEEDKFNSLNLEYINSPYHDFDSCIMSMKKVADRLAQNTQCKSTSDLGSAAYFRLNGFKCVGKKGRSFYFEVNNEDMDKFDMLNLEYVNSSYHEFDTSIMCLKKMGEYVSNECC